MTRLLVKASRLVDGTTRFRVGNNYRKMDQHVDAKKLHMEINPGHVCHAAWRTSCVVRSAWRLGSFQAMDWHIRHSREPWRKREDEGSLQEVTESLSKWGFPAANLDSLVSAFRNRCFMDACHFEVELVLLVHTRTQTFFLLAKHAERVLFIKDHKLGMYENIIIWICYLSAL